MVEDYIVSKLNAVCDLSGQIYPTAAPVGDCNSPFVIYTVMSSVPTRDLSGDIVSILDTIRVDLYSDDYDALCSLAQTVEDALTSECEEYEDLYIFYSHVSRGEADGFDMNMELHRKTISVTVRYWR